MPRTVDQILQHADDLAARFQDYEPDPAHELDPGAIALLRAAIQERSAANATSWKQSGQRESLACPGQPSDSSLAPPGRRPVSATGTKSLDLSAPGPGGVVRASVIPG